MKIGYLGPKSSFTYGAAHHAFPTAELVPFPNIAACIKAYFDAGLDWVVVPIENSIEGSVHSTVDQLFHHVDLPVQAEIVMPIQQQLMVHPNHKDTWQTATKIISHPQAIAQSQGFLERFFPEAVIENAPSTTNGASRVAQAANENYAAIGSTNAAEEFGLTIVAKDIQDVAFNQTRFWILGEDKPEIDMTIVGKKRSLALTLPSNKPGALHDYLGAFAWRKIDLTKIESRPLKTHLGEYFFLIDLKAEQPAELLDNASLEIKLLGGVIKEFGHYNVYELLKP